MSAGWTKSRIELMVRLWDQGRTAAQVAMALGDGITRNAVIGKLNRLGRNERVIVERQSSPKPRKAPRSVAVEDLVAQPIAHVVPEPIALPLSGRVTLLDLTSGMCRWPVGDPRADDFHFCAAPVGRASGTYCALHARIAYLPKSDRRQQKMVNE